MKQVDVRCSITFLVIYNLPYIMLAVFLFIALHLFKACVVFLDDTFLHVHVFS